MHWCVLVTVHCVLLPQTWGLDSEFQPEAMFPSVESPALVFLKDEGLGRTDWTS